MVVQEKSSKKLKTGLSQNNVLSVLKYLRGSDKISVELWVSANRYRL